MAGVAITWAERGPGLHPPGHQSPHPTPTSGIHRDYLSEAVPSFGGCNVVKMLVLLAQTALHHGHSLRLHHCPKDAARSPVHVLPALHPQTFLQLTLTRDSSCEASWSVIPSTTAHNCRGYMFTDEAHALICAAALHLCFPTAGLQRSITFSEMPAVLIPVVLRPSLYET